MKMTESCLQIEMKMAEACFFENENIFAGFIGLSKGALKSRSNRSSSCARKFDPNLSWKIPRFRSKKPAIVSTFVSQLRYSKNNLKSSPKIVKTTTTMLLQNLPHNKLSEIV